MMEVPLPPCLDHVGLLKGGTITSFISESWIIAHNTWHPGINKCLDCIVLSFSDTKTKTKTAVLELRFYVKLPLTSSGLSKVTG